MLTLTNVGSSYDATANAKGCGHDVRNFTGITQAYMSLFVNKVGTGTQSWQLWVTDLDGVSNGVAIGVIDDAGAAGDKWLSGLFDVSLTGYKVYRLRVKSTVAADDPVLYSASVNFR